MSCEKWEDHVWKQADEDPTIMRCDGCEAEEHADPVTDAMLLREGFHRVRAERDQARKERDEARRAARDLYGEATVLNGRVSQTWFTLAEANDAGALDSYGVELAQAIEQWREESER